MTHFYAVFAGKNSCKCKISPRLRTAPKAQRREEEQTTITANSLLAQNAVDEDDGSVNEAVTPHSAHHTQPLHRLVHVVHLVRQGLQLRHVALAQVAPLGLAPVLGHAVKHLLEPLEVGGQHLQSCTNSRG